MSVKVMGMVWDLQLRPNDKLVLLAYADHADHQGYNIFPSVPLIAQKTGYNVREVQYITKRLRTQGYLLPDGMGPRGTNRWHIPIVGAEIIPMPEAAGVQTLQGAKNAPVQAQAQGGAKPSRKGGAIAVAPEPSEPPLEPSGEEKQSVLEEAISIVSDHDHRIAERVRARLSKAISIVEEEGVIRIIGLPPTDAEWIASRWQKSIERALVGICNRPVRLVFSEVYADAA